jgi:hypothetical protein
MGLCTSVLSAWELVQKSTARIMRFISARSRLFASISRLGSRLFSIRLRVIITQVFALTIYLRTARTNLINVSIISIYSMPFIYCLVKPKWKVKKISLLFDATVIISVFISWTTPHISLLDSSYFRAYIGRLSEILCYCASCLWF